MKKLKQILTIGGPLAAFILILGVGKANSVHAETVGEINCTISHSELDALNHIQINWSCAQPIQDWVTVDFGDESAVDVLMDGTEAWTDHWFGFLPGYVTIHTIALTIPTGQVFEHDIIVDDSPQVVDCSTKVTPGDVHNVKLLVLECDSPTDGWAHFDFGDGAETDVWVQWLEDLQISWAYAEHAYAYDPYVTEAHTASITFQGVVYPLEVEIQQIEWGIYLPVISTP